GAHNWWDALRLVAFTVALRGGWWGGQGPRGPRGAGPGAPWGGGSPLTRLAPSALPAPPPLPRRQRPRGPRLVLAPAAGVGARLAPLRGGPQPPGDLCRTTGGALPAPDGRQGVHHLGAPPQRRSAAVPDPDDDLGRRTFSQRRGARPPGTQ